MSRDAPNQTAGPPAETITSGSKRPTLQKRAAGIATLLIPLVMVFRLFLQPHQAEIADWMAQFPTTPPGLAFVVDDFKNPREGKLYTGGAQQPGMIREYADGHFHMAKTDPDYSYPPGQYLTDYAHSTVEITARLSGETDGRYIFFTCRDSRRGHYELRVSPQDRRFRLIAFVGDQAADLVPARPSTAIHPGTESNRFEFTCSGHTIAASVNGVPIASVEDSLLVRGSWGLGVSAVGKTAEAWFDDLRVTATNPYDPLPRMRDPSPGTIVLADSFHDPALAVLPTAAQNASQVDRGYEQGEYHIRKVDPSYGFVASAILHGRYADTTTAITARVAGDPAGESLLLECRLTPDNRGLYRLSVVPARGTVRLYRRDGDQALDLVPTKVSEAVHRGNEPNRLELGCIGDTISAAVNGVQIGAVQDAAYAEGRLAIATSAPDGSTADAWFSDLVVMLGSPGAQPGGQ